MISVAMCSFNGERFIAQQLESILNQSLLPAEIVLSDDASSDGTVAIAQETVEGSSVTLRVIRNPTSLGVTANFEQAIRATSGELVALSDQDDVWAPNRLERAADEFDARQELLLLHGDARLVDQAGQPLGESLFGALGVTQNERNLISTGHGFEAFIRRNLVTGATTVLRRSLLERAIPFPLGWVHDEWLAIVAASTGTVDFVAEPLIDYRQHGGNQIGATKLSVAGKFRRMLEPRRARNDRLAANFSTLYDRLSVLDGVSVETVDLALRKRDHELARNAYPAARVRRLGPVGREWRTGRYALSARGAADVVRDLIQPVEIQPAD